VNVSHTTPSMLNRAFTVICPTGFYSETFLLNNPSLVNCTRDSDCDGVESTDGPICCIFPQCICGVSSATESTSVSCVGNPPSDESPSPSTADNITIAGFQSTAAGDLPSVPPSQTSQPSLSLQPSASPQPSISLQPSASPPLYECPVTNFSLSFQQNSPSLTPCTTNVECENVTTIDGGTCCIQPLCVCASETAGVVGGLSCLSDPITPEPTVTSSPSIIDRTGGAVIDDDDDVPVTFSPSETPNRNTCPESSYSMSFQLSNPHLTKCETDINCKDVVVSDGKACCLYPAVS